MVHSQHKNWIHTHLLWIYNVSVPIETLKPPEDQKKPRKAEERDDKPLRKSKASEPKSNPEIPREDNPYFKKLGIPHLDEIRSDVFEKGKVKIVLHPFYEMLLQSDTSFDEELWNDIKKHPEKYDGKKPPGLQYCEQWIIRELNRTLRESGEEGLSQRYWRVLEMVQEYQALMTAKDSTDTYLYILPKYHTFEGDHNKHHPELYDALIDIVKHGANKSSAFIESEQWSNGSLNDSDAALMQILIPKQTTLELSGGYIGKCMDNLFKSLKEPTNRSGWKVHVNVADSTPVMFFDNNNPGSLTDIPKENQPTYKAGQQFSSMDEVLAFVESNSQLNRFILEKSRQHLASQRKPAFVTYK